MRTVTFLPAAAAIVLSLMGCGDDASKPSPASTASSGASTATTAAVAPSAPSASPSAANSAGEGPAAASASVTPAPSPAPETSASAAPAASASASATSASADPKPTRRRRRRRKKRPEPVAAKPDPKPDPAPTAAPSAAPEPAPTAAPAVKPAPTVKLEPAAPGSADAVADKVDAIYKPIKRFRARFAQQYRAKVAGKVKKSEGVVYIQRPAQLSFTYREPNKNRVVSDGTTLKIYEHENKQMFVKKVADTEYPGALAFIMGKGLRQSFTFELVKVKKWEGGPVLKGTPRTASAGYKYVYFYIDDELLKKGDPGCVRRVLVRDAQDNRNRFDFLHVSQPASIKASEFTFDAPKGTQIVK